MVTNFYRNFVFGNKLPQLCFLLLISMLTAPLTCAKAGISLDLIGRLAKTGGVNCSKDIFIPSGLTQLANGQKTVTVPVNSAQDATGNGNTALSLSTTRQDVTSTAWTGAVSTDWFTAGNWTAGVPTQTIDATIPGSTVPFPNIAEGEASARNLTVNGGATINQSGGTLYVQANITNNGTFALTGGTVVLGTTAYSNIVGSGTIRFWNLTVGINGARLATSAGASVRRVLTLNGSFSTNGNTFTLESNSDGTAMVVNSGTSLITGTVTMQKYVSVVTGSTTPLYLHIGSPVSNATVANLATANYTPVVNPAFNNSAQPALERPFPTVYSYDQSRSAFVTNNLSSFNKGYLSPASTSESLVPGKGYTIYIPQNQTINFSGSLNNGTITINLARNSSINGPDAGYQFVSNPYPSPLDLRLMTAADLVGLDPAIYFYQSISGYIGVYTLYNNGFGTQKQVSNNHNPVIASGQGFWVRISDGKTSGSITFRNTQRLTYYSNPPL
jgi:hypothetical protein